MANARKPMIAAVRRASIQSSMASVAADQRRKPFSKRSENRRSSDRPLRRRRRRRGPASRRHQVEENGRHQRSRQEITRQHREHDGHRRGENRNPPTPLSRKIGTNTRQIDSVDTNAGVATSAAPSRIACRSGSQFMWRWLFSISPSHRRRGCQRRGPSREGHDVERLVQRWSTRLTPGATVEWTSPRSACSATIAERAGSSAR